MPNTSDIDQWTETIRSRYESYLKTSFFFKDPMLRKSFENALRNENALLKGPFPERAHGFKKSSTSAQELAKAWFPDEGKDLLPALIHEPLYEHQEQAIQATYQNHRNAIIATGTASGKTESFLYPILFELYHQHLAGTLQEPGVRALILYPMNALANDQRKRLGEIFTDLQNSNSEFQPTFGQYIGETPYNKNDRGRNAGTREYCRQPYELIFRDEMRNNPPHILLTNYSMLEYLLIRPKDSSLFDNGRGKHWQFIVLDEAHQYRGAKGMEMSMLIRRLKQRLREGGRESTFRCIATSATISSDRDEASKAMVAKFATNLFGESFGVSDVIFGEKHPASDSKDPRLFHVFLRALEGAFIVHKNGTDAIVLNRTNETKGNSDAIPLELALCRECGQHYYVGQERGGKLAEAIRDPSHHKFGVDYYIPAIREKKSSLLLCRHCGNLSTSNPTCSCNASIFVKKCPPHPDHADQLKECDACGFRRSNIGDPVQEIIHGSAGPSAVITTALHELLPKNKRKVLAFADNRQEAAFFAWYAEDSYQKLRERNLILRALKDGSVDPEGLSIEDLKTRLIKKLTEVGLFQESDTKENRATKVLTSIFKEALAEEKRISLSGVGLVKWFVKIPANLDFPQTMRMDPWNLTDDESSRLFGYLLDEFRLHRAISLPPNTHIPWKDAGLRAQWAYCRGPRNRQRNVSEWGYRESAVVRHFLHRLIMSSDVGSKLSDKEKKVASVDLMKNVWQKLQDSTTKHHGRDPILLQGEKNGQFRLNQAWLRIKITEPGDIWECDTCARLSSHNIRGICPRMNCHGTLEPAIKSLKGNHYKALYEIDDLPPELVAEEHTAQIQSHVARSRQEEFKNGKIHLLSSSTTFEVGVDLGDLEAVFLRNVPPESFNYTQRVGRVGRRGTPGLALTYCRRNPHDLYHFMDPEKRIIGAKIRPPCLQMTNEKIILRHVIAAALSEFFRNTGDKIRFANVTAFVGDWSCPCAASDLLEFCNDSHTLTSALYHIVPGTTHEKIGIADGSWINKITGPDSRFAAVEKEVCADYRHMEELKKRLVADSKYQEVIQIERHLKTIGDEQTLNFLSRKAIIPKYGFPVDVVQLDTRSRTDSYEASKILLQRDLSQAIAEYAAGSKVVANKLEWESYGIKMVPNKAWPIRHYQYDNARNFKQSDRAESLHSDIEKRQYLSPMFGFVTQLFKNPEKPRRQTERLYTTRPFFHGFEGSTTRQPVIIHGVKVTKAQPGTLIILCEGKNRSGFYVCQSCGFQTPAPRETHLSPSKSPCPGKLENFSLGHELNTDVTRLQFPQLTDESDAYSVAYAVLLGAAEALNVPDIDLNATIAGSDSAEFTIVLYDNVPGGAGLVAQLAQTSMFDEMLRNAQARIDGSCGCDSSCYGCLRSYRNQFVHTNLNRKRALEFLIACNVPKQ